MKRVKHIGIAIAVIVFIFVIFSQTVYASTDIGTFDWNTCSYYIDAGTGSIIIQVLIGAAVAGVAMIGVYRMRVKKFPHQFIQEAETGQRE